VRSLVPALVFAAASVPALATPVDYGLAKLAAAGCGVR
jgi:hypothetical protein